MVKNFIADSEMTELLLLMDVFQLQLLPLFTDGCL
jgi:hypothetical protein